MLMVKIPVFLVLLIALVGVIEELYPKPDFSPILPSFINDIMFVEKKSELPNAGIIGALYFVEQIYSTSTWTGKKYVELLSDYSSTSENLNTKGN